MTDWNITAKDLEEQLQRRKIRLIDVREPHEWEIGYIAGAELMPLGEVPQRWQELHKEEDIVFYCKAGGRSMQALEYLRRQGFTKLKNLQGGINAWSREVDANVPLY